jgi:hypothetical protein
VARSYVGTELEYRSSASYSGFIDILDSRVGVRGWAVNLADPLDAVLVQLCAGDQVIGETFAEGDREDISAKLGRPARAGFSFDARVFRSLPDYLDDPQDTLAVRIAATGQFLTAAEAEPTIGDLLIQLQADRLPEVRSSTADFELLLDELRQAAGQLAQLALRPVPEGLQGYVETLAVDTSGQVWFMGWMKRGHLQEFSAVLVERRKFPGAVAVMCYARDDLPQDCCGVIGVIASAWRPSSATSELIMFFGSGGRFHLRANTPLRLVTSGELASEYEAIRERCLGEGRAIALQRMLTAMENWLPSKTAGQWYATETSVDRVLLVPGLGCLVEGWVLSPLKRIDALRIRIGASVMSAHQDSLYWKPRPDLVAAFPGCERMVDRAGFVGLFLGDADPEDFSDPLLKVVFRGGSSANFPLQPNSFRRLGHSAVLDDALLFFPALPEEVFFPRFAEAAIRADRDAMNPPVAISITRGRLAMVMVLPEDRCDLFLLFEELAQRCRVAGWLPPLVLVAAARSNRSDALWLFREFQQTHAAAHAIACSLLVIDDTAQAFALLPAILAEVGASRFIFVGAGIFLTEAGWAKIAQVVSPEANGLVLFALQKDEFGGAESPDGITARCFAWNVGHFTRWALQAPNFMGGFFRDNGLLSAAPVHVVHHNAARATRTSIASRIQHAVNSAIYARLREAPIRRPARQPSAATPAALQASL